MKKTPCETFIWDILPCIRRELAENFLKHGMSKSEIAEKIGVSKAAVSQYLSKKRGAIACFDESIIKEIKKSAEKIVDGGDIIVEVCRICCIVKEKID